MHPSSAEPAAQEEILHPTAPAPHGSSTAGPSHGDASVDEAPAPLPAPLRWLGSIVLTLVGIAAYLAGDLYFSDFSGSALVGWSVPILLSIVGLIVWILRERDLTRQYGDEARDGRSRGTGTAGHADEGLGAAQRGAPAPESPSAARGAATAGTDAAQRSE